MAEAGNKIAVVTGAGTGVGRAASLALMNAGFTVVLAGRRMEMLQETQKLGDNAGQSLPVSADMTDPASIAALFAKVMEVYGRLDVLFNNAGMGAPPVNFEDLSLAQWQAVVNTNLTGPFLCTQHAFRIMKDQTPRGGRIINNGSISAHAPRPFSSAYTSTKHAITGLTKATNLDGRMYDIAVGQVDIGNAATPMTDRMVAGPGVMQPDGTMKQEPRMDAKAVGDAVAYMAGLPLDANVLFMTVMATKMPFVGRGKSRRPRERRDPYSAAPIVIQDHLTPCLHREDTAYGSLRSQGRRVEISQRVPYSSRSTLRSVGNSFIHNSAIAMVPTPPSTAAGIAPNKAAVTPLSNWPSWLEALMNRKFTAPTRPRISSGVASWTSEKRITTLTISAAPRIASASTDSHIHCDSANTTVATPNTITA